MITDALQDFEKNGAKNFRARGHLEKYLQWLYHFRDELLAGNITNVSADEYSLFSQDMTERKRLYEEVQSHNADGELAVRMGTNIVGVLKGEIDPMHLMFGQDDLLNRVYDEVIQRGDLLAYLEKYLSVFSSNRKNLKILEIGAGTGSSTEPILRTLCPRSSERSRSQHHSGAISKYTFTDVSAGFFEKARQRFEQWEEVMLFHVLDIEKDVTEQGFDASEYDLIIAGNVIHATEDVKKTLTNLRRLLKPGGKLLMHEVARRDLLWTPLAFGQLPGWWLSTEESRQWGPMMPSSEWTDALKVSGFSGVDIELPSSSNPELNLHSILVSTAIDQAKSQIESIKILLRSTDQCPGISSYLVNLSQRLGWNASMVSIDDLETEHDLNSTYVSLLEICDPFLADANQENYYQLRRLMTTCKRILWVTGSVVSNPKMNAVLGLLRAVRSEREVEPTNLMSLELDNKVSNDGACELLSKLLRYHCEAGSEDADNSEYMYSNGTLFTHRLFDSQRATDFVNSRSLKPEREMKIFGEAGRPIKLSIASPGLLEELEWVTDEVASLPPSDTTVEVEVHAVGLNFRDVMIAMGEYMAHSFGNEAAGIVTRVGHHVTKFQPGDRVVFLGGLETGCFHTLGRTDQKFVTLLPESIPFSIAAGLPCVWATVLYGLREVAHLAQGETILIHAAAGGVGQAAVQYAKLVGANIYATVSTPEKRSLLTSEYGIPDHQIFSSRDLKFARAIMLATGDRGVDVVLNSLSGDALRKSWECIAPLGRFIEIGKKDAQSYGRVELTPFLRNVTMASVELTVVMRQRPAVVEGLLSDVVNLYNEGKIHEAKPTTVLKYSEIQKGLRQLQSGKGMGKIVLVREDNDQIPTVPLPPQRYKFNSGASYVLAGGLGGIGRSIASWMASRGARHLIFLSRSKSEKSSIAQDIITDLKAWNCHATILCCDIANSQSVEEVLGACIPSLPPIKGCIQCAMVLKVCWKSRLTK